MTPEERAAQVTDIANDINELLDEKATLDAANPDTVGTYERWIADSMEVLLKTINTEAVVPPPAA